MSIEIVHQCKEGLALESNVTGNLGLGFPAHVAALIASQYKVVVANDPIAQGIKAKAVIGRPDQLAIMLGIQKPFPVEFRVYPLGEADGETFELWVSEDEEGNSLMAYNTLAIRVEGRIEEDNAVMAVYGFEADDLDEVLEALGTDLSGEESVEA